MTKNEGNTKGGAAKGKGGGGGAKLNRAPKPSKAQPRIAKRIGNASTNPNRPLPDKMRAGFYRTKSTINRLNMYRAKPDYEKRKERPNEPVRIQPDRRWFGNVRVITQTKLEQFREAMEVARKDPYSVVLKRSKLPVSLFAPEDTTKQPKVELLTVEPYSKVFGKQQPRKKPKIAAESLSQLQQSVDQRQESYSEDKDLAMLREEEIKDTTSAEIFKKGTSRRIWGELYKVIDSSDVIVQVVDARDPMGTRCRQLEQRLKKDRPNKYLVLLLNKSDLIPSWVVSRWVKILASEYPTLAFHSSVTNPFGKQALINLLRQYASLLKDRKHVSVGFIGYPNVGKSSVINTLRKKKVCKAAPVPGETKVWQYVALTNRVYLIDCPGVLPDPEGQNETAKVLKGVIRAERIEDPETHIAEVLARATDAVIRKRYNFTKDVTWEDAEDFLAILARKMGKLLKGGEPDICTAARIVLYDWQRGRIPFFVPPPSRADEGDEDDDDGGNADEELIADEDDSLNDEEDNEVEVSDLETNYEELPIVTSSTEETGTSGGVEE